jgi:hypothetical protein
MKVIILPPELYDYLAHIIKAYTASGIDPDEGMLAFGLWQRVKHAQEIDVSKLGKVELAEIGPEGVTLEINPPEAPVPA